MLLEIHWIVRIGTFWFECNIIPKHKSIKCCGYFEELDDTLTICWKLIRMFKWIGAYGNLSIGFETHSSPYFTNRYVKNIYNL